MKKKKFTLLTFVIIINHFNMLSNELPSNIIEYLESTEESKIDGEEIIDLLEELKVNPLDINKSSKEELLQLPFLNEMDANNIVLHRKKYGKFQTQFELKHIPNFTIEKIEKILPYLTISIEEKEKSIKEILAHNSHTISLYYQRNFPPKKGYISDNNQPTYYTGDANRYNLKYRFNAKNILYAGYAGEKDAGEPFWSTQNKVFDFHSMYLQINRYKKIKSLCIGDYKGNFGQGLIIGSSSIFGKSSNTVHSNNTKMGINRYTSLNETNYLRGIGATINIKKWDYSLFLSFKKKDSNLNQEGITSFRTDGLHRSENELAKKRNIKELIVGSNIKYGNDYFDIGGTFLYVKYSHDLATTDKLYLKYRPQGSRWHLNFGLDYKLTLGRILIYGETAMSRSRGIATINAATFNPTSRLSFLILHRNYQPEYQSLFGNAFGENSRVENEKGLYVGWRVLPIKRITLSAYTDLYRFPWAKYGIDKSSSGKDYLIDLQYNTSHHINMQLRYKRKIKSENKEIKGNIRYGIKGEWKRLKCQTQLDGNRHQINGKKTTGWLVAQDIELKSTKEVFKGSIRYAYFCTDSYNNRIYLYEKDATNGFSMPIHHGKGHRVGINATIKIGQQLQVRVNGASFIYTDDREKCGNSYEESRGNKTYQIKCCIKWKI